MLVTVDSKVLKPREHEFLFREETISALKLLMDAGYIISISGAELSENQKQLLNQEGIEVNSHNSGDYSISTEQGGFVLRNKDIEETARSTTFLELAQILVQPQRTAQLQRKTNETDINIQLNLDGTGKSEIDTGLKFFDHMLDQIAKHALIDLKITCKGDLEVDEHHTIEDVSIALGETLLKALGDKKGLERFGFVLAMDEAQATVALDLSNRPYLVFDVPMKREYVGDFPTEMLEHFFYSLAMNLKATLHVACTGENDHHKIEACFKGFARSLKTAIEQNGRIKNQIPSSKGTL